ncbi:MULTISPECIES: Crp/Fnr family transcriptional regulator [Cellulophaga]|uniref:Transcriptional regulator, Crp/Fnr family n=2 Tax=Cellulophaga TaxID=104264 RepID=F0RBV4_CELLC|nr:MULTISPECIES: Crp/Fnr family transcriptional regulator [Cellulophaga]ADY28570.1 transcriptional regulator, Crp/Fnr family [Cellulophaga lytica DSM 7489]AIM59623.1 transcriptional regulator [Cellulophaga lytica]APU09484.1 transcriptional regulator [Cellulophaga lytica]EWH12941.1 Crp/Fnr family transcriptional regulator [Cellulophaga geojensis KL-A]MDO6853873.1 Crp/Fnr family transcriptional regulator [Cellulophaga lytica]
MSGKYTFLATSCKNCVNTECLVKRSVLTEQDDFFSSLKTEISCKKGQQFIIEGAPVNGLFFILKGKVKVYRTGINGKEQIVRFAKEGEIIGHRGFGTEEYYSIGAIALEDTVLCYYSKNSLQQKLKSNATFTYDMMLFYANELNRSEAKLKTISQMTVRERVVDSLLYIHRKFKDYNGFLNLQLSRREYADYAGTTEEQVIRVFSALKKESLIFTKGKKIGITNITLLKKEISEHNYYLDL